MPRKLELEGLVFGTWRVLRYEGLENPYDARRWWCQCTACGVVRRQSPARLRANVQCNDCYRAARRVPDPERVCEGCGRSTLQFKRSKPKECPACERSRIRRKKGVRPVFRWVGLTEEEIQAHHAATRERNAARQRARWALFRLTRTPEELRERARIRRLKRRLKPKTLQGPPRGRMKDRLLASG